MKKIFIEDPRLADFLMCGSKTYPYLPHGRDFSLESQAHLLLMGLTGATCYCTDAGLFCTVALVSLACVHL